MLANTPSPLKRRRSQNSSISNTNSSSGNFNNTKQGDESNGVLTSSAAVLSDMSLSHDFNDEEEDVDWGQFTLGEQASHEAINDHLMKQASLERSMGSELGTPANSPRNGQKGRSNPYARGQDRPANQYDNDGLTKNESKDVITPLVKVGDGKNGTIDSSGDDPLKKFMDRKSKSGYQH